jgi:predicted DNA-binding protein
VSPRQSVEDIDAEYNQSYTPDMKTAISLPDEVFESAEQLAKRLGKSRSELYVVAINEYIDRNTDTFVQESLDRVYSRNDSHVDPTLNSMQLKSIVHEEW